jgi:hypothetical protein
MNATFEGVREPAGCALLNPIAACFVPAEKNADVSVARFAVFKAPAREPKARLLDYLGMDGHLNRRQFNRCVWAAAFMLVGSAAAILGTIGYFAK